VTTFGLSTRSLRLLYFEQLAFAHDVAALVFAKVDPVLLGWTFLANLLTPLGILA
jgi:hypothetical protein